MEKQDIKYQGVPTQEPLTTIEDKKAARCQRLGRFFKIMAALVLGCVAFVSLFPSCVNMIQSRLNSAEKELEISHPNFMELQTIISNLRTAVGDHGCSHHDKDHEHKPFCHLEELDAQSTVFEFSPEQFKHTKLVLNGETNRGGHITVGQSEQEDAKDVKVTVTVYAGRPERHAEVSVSAFEEKGAYVVQLERQVEHGRHPHRKPKQKDCLVYSVHIEFPPALEYYESLHIHAKKAQRIEGGFGAKNIQFGSFDASLGWGAIIFHSLRAKEIRLAVLYGVVMGTYEPEHLFLAATVKGASKVHLLPTSETFNATIASTFGPATLDIPSSSFSGNFTLHRLLGPDAIITAPHPEDIHVTRTHFGGKDGYFQKPSTGSNIIISAKVNGAPSLFLNE